MLEYALKKEKLLLEVRKKIDIGTLIDLIAAGLPNYLSDKIDRETLQQTEDLYNEIGKLEHLVGKNKYDKKNYTHSDIKTKTMKKRNHAKFVSMKEKGNVFILRKTAGLMRRIKNML